MNYSTFSHMEKNEQPYNIPLQTCGSRRVSHKLYYNIYCYSVMFIILVLTFCHII